MKSAAHTQVSGQYRYMALLMSMTLAASSACVFYDPINALPPNDIASVLKAGGPPAGKRVLVLVGDSITQGTIGYRWAEDVARSLGDDWFVVNAGTNGEIAWDIAERTDDVIACNPDVVSVLVGTNDAMAAYDPDFYQSMIEDRGLSAPLDATFYREQLTRVADSLREGTEAGIALLSIPTLGENRRDAMWSLSEEYAGIVRDVATQTRVRYGPLFERMDDDLGARPARVTPRAEEWSGLMTSGIAAHQFGQSWDEIGEARGFYLHTDPLHLDVDGGSLVALTVLDIVREIAPAE